MDDRPTLLRNDSDEGHWITLRLVGRAEQPRRRSARRSPSQAGGRRQVAMVHSGGSYLSHNDMRVHFGLGATATVDQITIRWPSGQVDTLGGLAADRFYVAREGAGVKPGSRAVLILCRLRIGGILSLAAQPATKTRSHEEQSPQRK